MRKTFRFLAEDRPGEAWRARFAARWPATKTWYLKEGLDARPSLADCDAAFDRDLPALKPMWQHLCAQAGGGDLESRVLSHWSPPNVFAGCSVAVIDDGGPVLVRNYDFDPNSTGSEIVRSAWNGRAVIGLNEGFWGLLDGMNDAGLAACLTFGGRPACGQGFSVILVLRYLLETCATAGEARELLLSLRTYLSQNIVVLDAGGAHFTAIMAPDRPTRIWDTRVTTNHPETVEWPESAAWTRTVERFDHLSARLDAPGLVQEFLRPPLYGMDYSGGMGTVYTALYRPDRGEATFRWPDHEVRQSFADFTEASVAVAFADGRPAVAA